MGQTESNPKSLDSEGPSKATVSPDCFLDGELGDQREVQ